MDYYQFLFEINPGEERNMLIAMLSNIGFDGFEEEEKFLNGFIAIDDFEQKNFEEIINLNSVKYSRSLIRETNWNEKWEQDFKPVIVNHPDTNLPFASVRANFHSPVAGTLHEIIITPKMSFGTGHHATTCLMIQQMSLLNFQEKTVIDFGTGTGILAILAEKLGASKIIAIDYDDWCISNAKENITANNCTRIELIKGENISNAKSDIILANINLNIIIENLDEIKCACKPEATVLFSGILLHDEEKLTGILKEKNFIIHTCSMKDTWMIIVAINKL